MSPASDATLDDVDFDEIERVDQYEATFTGTLEGVEITLSYALESAIGEDETPVYAPGDEALEQVLVRPETYEFETDSRETVRFTASDDDGRDLFLIYVFAEAEDAADNEVGLSVDPSA